MRKRIFVTSMFTATLFLSGNATSLPVIDGVNNIVIPVQILEHGGRTNKDGCHKERKTGGYHCH